MDKFVEDMLKSAERKGKEKAYKPALDPSQIEQLTKGIQDRIKKK
jgi:hypothetical protein